jgi:DNA-binding NarL/FixJ family response regulator
MTRSEFAAADRTVKVLLVDDHAMLREGLVGFLSEQPGLQVCGEASGAPEAMQQVVRNKPDFVVVDLSLKEGSGLDLVRRLDNQHENVPTLIHSMHGEAFYRDRGIAD